MIEVEEFKAAMTAMADRLGNESNGHTCCLVCVQIGFQLVNVMFGYAHQLEASDTKLVINLYARLHQLMYQNDRIGLRDFVLSLRDGITQNGLDDWFKCLGEEGVEEIKIAAQAISKPTN